MQSRVSDKVATGQLPPKPLSLAWNLLYVPVLLFVAALVLYVYPSMPEQIPMQVNLSGEVTRSVQKSLVSALFPVWVDLFFAICFVFAHWSVNKQKQPIDPARPAASAYAFGAYRRALCVMLLVSGILLCLCVGIVLPLSTVGVLTIMQCAIIILIVAVVIVIGSIVFALVFGRNGSRLLESNNQAPATQVCDDDKYWKAGVFYVNAKDPHLFVSKRFGVGTTINFGNKSAWVVVVGFVVIVGLFTALFLAM